MQDLGTQTMVRIRHLLNMKIEKQLNKQLDQYLEKAKKEIEGVQKVKAIIGPHAGLDYSGPTAAWSYQYLQPADNLRVFLLGPCHYTYMKGIGLSKLQSYKTPLGDIQIDQETTKQLASELKGFVFTNKDVEEEEHSLELHLPFIQKMLKDKPFKLVPIMVGVTEPQYEMYLGSVLQKYFADDNSLFIISSDFCHWGKRFDYTYYKKNDGQIWESIEKLDKRCIELIEKHDVNSYYKYFDETDNSVCGRHPIGVVLNNIQLIYQSDQKDKLKTKLTIYSQSNKVTNGNDSSVSYAAILTYL